MRRHVTFLMVLAMGLALTAPAFAQTVLFGPKQYTRTAGPPNQFTDTFTLPAGTTAPYTLHVVNGNANGTNRISSATVKLNGVQIAGPNDFGQNVAVIDRAVALQASNTLEIRLTSAPGSFLVVSVLDTGVGAQPTALTPSPLNLVAGATGTLTATLAPAPTAAGSLAVSSANSAVVNVPASVAFAAGQTSVPVTVTAVASGSTTVTVTLNGGSAASQVDVALPAPTVSGFAPTSGQPGTSVTVTGTNFVNVQTVIFNGVLAPTFTVTDPTTLVAVVPPTATTGPIAIMTLAGTGTSAASFTVIPAPSVASLQPATLSIVRGSTGTLTATLSAVQTTPTSITLSSSNASIATVPGTVTVPANQLSAPVTVTALAQGQADITASLNATSASSTVTVVNPVPSITTLSPASAPSGSPATTLTITGQQFVSGAIVRFGVTGLTTTFVNATQLTALIPATALTANGTMPVTVENPAPGGGASNSLPFTIVNGPPQLAPIGNQTVPLGSTLTFTTTAADPDNDPVTFAVTPLPLPDRATFNSQTGQFTFTPLATQVGAFTLTFIATDGISQDSETLTITVTGAPVGGITGVSGRVVDGAGQPIANLPVSLKGTTATTTTNTQGQFTLNNLTVSGRQVLLANGFALGYAILAAPVDLIPNVMNNLASELRVPVIDMASAVTVNPNATTVLGNPAFPAVSVTIPPHTAKNPDGTDYTGQLTISPVPEYGRPESRPVELKPGFSITIQPAGIAFTTPAPITLPNTDNLPVGNEFDLWSLSPDTGTFYVAGRMKVSADGSKLETLSGGVRKTAWHFALAPAASVPNDQNRIIGGCTTCTIGSGGDLTEGTLTQDVTIPGIRTLGVSRDLTLHYTSTTADVRPILPVTATLDVRAAVPQTFSAEMTVGGLKQGTRGYWNASPMNENATSSTRLGVQYDASPLPTGRYPYELATFSNYGQSSIGAISRGFTMIRNEQQSAVGAGWTLRGVDRIVLSSGTSLLAMGDGRTIPYPRASISSLTSLWAGEGNGQDQVFGNTGSLLGGVTFTTGQLGQAFSFDGVDDYVRVPHNANLDPGTGSFSIDAWIKTTNSTALQTIVAKHECSQFCIGFSRYFFQVSLGKLFWNIREGLNPNPQPEYGQLLGGNRIVADGVWHHVAAVRDMTTRELRLYVDGQMDGAVPLSDSSDGPLTDEDGEADPLAIGATVNYGGTNPIDVFVGSLDEVGYWGRALSVSEASAIYTSGGRRNLTADFLSPPSEYSVLKQNPNGTYTRTLKDGTIYQFNVQGLQTGMADRNGNQTTYAYNGSSQLMTITDPAGQVTTLSYSGSRLTTITDPAGRVTQLTHDSAGNLTTVEAADQSRHTFIYDPQHRMTQRTDAQNQVYAYQFDHAGRLQRATLPGGAFREIRPTELTAVPNLAAGQGTLANPATITQPPIVQATFKDARGHTTTFETDPIGRVTKQIDSLNRTTTIARDPQGNPLTITRPNGAVTNMTYDAKGNLLTSTEQAIAATTTFTYEPTFNQVTSIRDPKNNLTTITYDLKGNPLTITDADNKVTTFTYNAQGLLLTSKDALNQTTTFTYDALGRLLTTTDPLSRTTTLTYDVAGNVATSTDALTRVTTFLYDQKNRLKQVTDPATGVTTYTYDGNGNLLTVKDAKNQTTTFAYDNLNRLASTTDPLGKVETYEYDGADNLTKRITPKLDQIVFAYDVVNQLLSKTLPGSLVIGYTYDTVGNPTGVTDPDSALTMTYDLANRLLTTATTGSSNQPNVTLTYTYDKNGNRLTLAGPSGNNTYVYDVVNRLTSMTSPAGATALAYDALSRRTSLTLPNGTQTTYSYDPASQVTQILHQLTATSAQINQADYIYNNVGNRTSLTDRRGAQSFGYDNLDRLTSASHPLLATPQAFAYDPVGNRTTNGSVVNAGNQLTADANFAYQYDDNGNLTRKTFLATGNYSQYTYDAENRLIQVQEFAAGNPTAFAMSTYRYDGLGRRIEKLANGQMKRFIYDGEDILLEYDATNTLQARYTHGSGIDEPIAVTRGGSTFFYHQDGLGTVTELTDSTGATAKAYAYDAYGSIVNQTGSVDQPYTYTGRELDSETGLYYYRARYYDPRIGRFLQTDPNGVVGGDINPFRYVRSNPVNFIDPYGLADKPPKENIKPSTGDPIGDRLRNIENDKTLSPERRKEKLQPVERDINRLSPGERKKILKGFLKVIKRGSAVCLILEFLEEILDPDTDQDPTAS